jgi:hypothetical protein
VQSRNPLTIGLRCVKMTMRTPYQPVVLGSSVPDNDIFLLFPPLAIVQKTSKSFCRSSPLGMTPAPYAGACAVGSDSASGR